METPTRAGFNRGSADALAKRPYDKSVPAEHRNDSKSYRRGYRKGYKTKDVSGLSLGGSVSLSYGDPSSPSGGSSSPSGGAGLLRLQPSAISALAAQKKSWAVSPVAVWQGPSKGAREAMLVRALRQAGASGKPILVSFFLRRGSDLSAKALGDDELLAYGIVQSVNGDGYDARTYETKVTSYARYTPSGPAEGAPPADAPPIGTTFTLQSNDLASMVLYDAPQDQGLQATLPDAVPSLPQWKDLIASLDELDRKIASIDAVINTKDTTVWGPKYDSFVKPWRETAANIRVARAKRNEYADPVKAERAILAAKAVFAALYDEWNTLKPKSRYSDYQKKDSGKSSQESPPPGGSDQKKDQPADPGLEQKKDQPAEPGLEQKKDQPAEPGLEQKKDQPAGPGGGSPAEDSPPQIKPSISPTDVTPMSLVGPVNVRSLIGPAAETKKSLTQTEQPWLAKNWMWLALGGAVLVGGGYAYMHYSKKV